MDLREAIAAIYSGKKVALPEFEGYWFLGRQGKISVMTRDNKINETPWFEKYVDRTDWLVVGERHDRVLPLDCGCESSRRMRIVFADLDGTLIETKSGKTFPEDKHDWKLKQYITNALRMYSPTHLFIVSNQGGIEKGFITKEDFADKMENVVRELRIQTQIPVVNFIYCSSNDKDNINRKPNTGMIDRTIMEFFGTGYNEWYKNLSLMIGDASGKEGDFSDSDKKCAENAGIEYMDVEDFIHMNLDKMGNSSLEDTNNFKPDVKED